MSQTKKEMHKMLSEHEKTLSDYVDPWGLRGGLFVGVLVAVGFLLAVITDGIDLFEAIAISFAIAAIGYGGSQRQNRINMLGAMNGINSKTIIILYKQISRLTEISERQDRLTTKQQTIIKEQDELITRLRG